MILIGELAHKTGLSVRTIRFYEEKGVIESVERDANNKRLFDDDETVHWLIFVRYLRKTGMSITDIQEYRKLIDQGDDTIPERIRILEKQKTKVLADIQEKYTEIEQIDHKLNNYRNGVDGFL
ncbi:MerR family transcriptional regulator [Lentilactobacillus sp. SPB1-3]|uniref:MerR family transcriptional regulator n=1 Tax=Lentilactobacillus terminaliae TaxID=3003483 RepID=A0ACD5DG18_9LACO|nr:MerR family transcriptional regulator [Lentilactobacillus sp. SPB1-3]MCZ0976606.1 MerR family transcriptional regulator [Lentilactobacillus sp. SPB1-3]